MQIFVGTGPASKGYNVDAVAAQLAYLGDMARQMPRTFDLEAMTYNVDSPSGGPGSLGKILPGRGFLPAVDLHSLGITRRPRGVLDPSAFRRKLESVEEKTLRDRHWDKMLGERGRPPVQGGAISTYDGIISSRGSGKANDIAFLKTSITTVANTWSTLIHAGGQPPALTYLATTAPTDALISATNAAAISTYLANPGGTDKKYLLTFGYGASQQINMAVLADVGNHGGSFRTTVTTAETVTTPTSTTRQYGSGSGVGNLLTFVVATAGTSNTTTAGTFTAQYVDQAAANTNAPALTTSGATATLTADTLYPSSAGVTAGAGSFFVPLASASTGVQAVKQTTFNQAQVTSVLASLVFFPLSFVPGLAANAYIERDSTTQIDGITELINVSQQIGFLSLFVLTNTTSTGALTGYLRTVSG